MIEVIRPELVCVEDQAVILVIRILIIPHSMVILGHIDLGVVEVPLAVARVRNTAHY